MIVEIHTETGSFNKNQKHKVVLTVYIWYYTQCYFIVSGSMLLITVLPNISNFIRLSYTLFSFTEDFYLFHCLVFFFAFIFESNSFIQFLFSFTPK